MLKISKKYQKNIKKISNKYQKFDEEILFMIVQ
jgi:hypothetical protein